MTLSEGLNLGSKISLLYGMLLIRRLEEALVSEYPKQEIRCPVHFSIGQEAIAVGVSSILTNDDWVVSNHRSHAHYIAKGGDLFSFISELYGKENGCCAGRGGSMHLTDLKAGFLASIPIVGSSLPIAAGVAMSQQRNNSKSITVAYIGDATAESGSFHETLNFVSLHNLPLMTVCENNEYSVYSPLRARQPANRTILGLAKSHGVKTFEGNGDDVEEVEEFLNDLLISTDIVVEGMNLVTNLSSGEAIAYRALAKLAQGIELAIHWIQSNTETDEDNEDDDVLGLLEDNDEL